MESCNATENPPLSLALWEPDDDTRNRTVHLLARLGFHVHGCRDVAGLFQWLDLRDPDLVLVGASAPVGQVVEAVLPRLSAHYGAGILLQAPDAAPQTRLSALQAGAHLCLDRRYEATELAALLRAQARRAARQRRRPPAAAIAPIAPAAGLAPAAAPPATFAAVAAPGAGAAAVGGGRAGVGNPGAGVRAGGAAGVVPALPWPVLLPWLTPPLPPLLPPRPPAPGRPGQGLRSLAPAVAAWPAARGLGARSAAPVPPRRRLPSPPVRQTFRTPSA